MEDEKLLEIIRHYQQSLDKYTSNRNDSKLSYYIRKLYKLPVRMVHLENTGIGRTVNALKKLGGEVGESAKSLVTKWKVMVIKEQAIAEDTPDSHQDDNSDSDQSDSRSTQKSKKSSHTNHSKKHDEAKREHRSNGQSSHNKIDKIKNKNKKEHEIDLDEEDAKRHKKNTSSVDLSSNHKLKRKNDVGSSSDEASRKKSKPEIEQNKKVEDSKNKIKSHSESKSRDKHRKSSSALSDNKLSLKKSTDRKSSRDKKDDHSKERRKSVSAIKNGSGLGSGGSFAEALGMCEPSCSKSQKKKSNDEKSKSTSKEKIKSERAFVVPKLIKEEPLEAADLNISSLLPTISPNYRPLGNALNPDSSQRKSLNEYEELSNAITSKTQRTKVYSGNKTGCGKVPTLFEICVRFLQDNIDALEYTGGVPYIVLKPVLDKANPDQLFTLEHHNPYLVEETDGLWKLHCQREFRNKHRVEYESWRDMYMRCLDEREAKLIALTANIKQAQDKSMPVRTTKLAYVDDVAKPPRNVARKQAKNGTAGVGIGFDKKPAITPASRLSALATAGEAGKISVPNPVSRVPERSSGMVKPKKAPLMAKSLSLLKNRFRR